LFATTGDGVAVSRTVLKYMGCVQSNQRHPTELAAPSRPGSDQPGRRHPAGPAAPSRTSGSQGCFAGACRLFSFAEDAQPSGASGAKPLQSAIRRLVASTLAAPPIAANNR